VDAPTRRPRAGVVERSHRKSGRNLERVGGLATGKPTSAQRKTPGTQPKGKRSKAETELERVKSGCTRGKPEAGENSRGELGRRGLTSHVGQQHSSGEQSPEVDSHQDGAGQTAGLMEERQEGRRPAKAGTAPGEGKTPEEENPERGSGMKQARKVDSGRNRRERAKR